MADFAPFSIEETLYVHSESGVSQFPIKLDVRAAKKDYVCEVTYGLEGDLRSLPIFGISPWQALMLGLKTLFRELELIEPRLGGAFYHSEEHARERTSPRSVEDVFSQLTPDALPRGDSK